MDAEPETPPGTGHRPLPHTADAGFEVWAPDMEGLLVESAVALFGLMGRAPDGSTTGEDLQCEAVGVDREDLLVRVLSELLVGFVVDGTYVTGAVCRALRTVDGGDLAATLVCSTLVVERTSTSGLAEIKAVTYHGLHVVEPREGGLRATVYLDL